MKKKVLCLILALSMIFSLAACGSSEKESGKTAEQESQEDGGADETDGSEAENDAEDAQETEGEVNEYGLTPSQQEALLESVKASLKENFLDVKGIAAEDFVLEPFDAQDYYSNYEYISSGASSYAGQDPYEFSYAWKIVEDFAVDRDLLVVLPATYDIGDEKAITYLRAQFPCADADTLEQQCAKYSIEVRAEAYDLANALYIGIKNFLNELDDMEWAQVLTNLVTVQREAEKISYAEYPAQTLFDRVISENIEL